MLDEYYFDNIYIRHAVDEHPDDRDFTMHIHEQCEIYFFISGNAEYLVEGSVYPLNEKSLLIMRPAEAHKARIRGNGRYERYALNFPLSFADFIDPEGMLISAFIQRPLGKSNMFSAEELDMPLAERLFSQMCSIGSDYERQLSVKTHLITLLDMISRSYKLRGRSENTPRSNGERIVLYVNSRLFDDISVPELAKHFYLSPSQFGRLFRQATGAAPWEYITKKRLTAAKEKLRNGFSAQQAAESCGFGDYSSFYRAYTKHFGCSPTEKNKDCTS